MPAPAMATAMTAPSPMQMPVLAMPSVSMPEPVMPSVAVAQQHSPYEGFSSFAKDDKPLTIDDIVKGLSRSQARRQPQPVEPPPMPKVEPIYENVEPIEPPAPAPQSVPHVPSPAYAAAPVMAAQRPVAEVHTDVPAFIEALLAGDRERCFHMLREVARTGGDTEA